MDETRTAHRHGCSSRGNLCVMKGARPMRMSIALPIVAALTIGMSSIVPAQGKTPAACKSERIASARNCPVYPQGQSCHTSGHAVLAQCVAGAQGRGGGVKTGAGQPAPKGTVLYISSGANAGARPPVVRQSKR